ncbi:hypothetical protein C455_10688 [Haloferax larsenii JCM 13917]|nr:DUF418 domain-containing protein [Haloferax larsenii]ELZ78143.1 hypothetical protein C455_10688 [Haloferax larsenii JCM 13917]
MSDRIIGYDVARSFAVVGMVIVNFEIVMGADSNGPHWVLSLSQLFHGRAAALFVVLAGVGITLYTNRARLAGDSESLRKKRDTLFRRAVFLFVVGLLYVPIWPADILHFYGLYLTIGALAVTASRRRLWMLTSGFVLGFVVLLFAIDYERGWDFATLTYTNFWTVRGMVRHLLYNGFHPVFPWVAFLLYGMLLGRLNLQNVTLRRRVLAGALAVVAVAESASWMLTETLASSLSSVPQSDIVSLFGTQPMPPMPLYILAGAGTATVVITGCLELCEYVSNEDLLEPFVSTGQMALSLYVAHVLLGMGALEMVGRLENQSPPFAMASALTFSALGIVFSYLWLQRYSRGPLEQVMRTVTDRTLWR